MKRGTHIQLVPSTQRLQSSWTNGLMVSKHSSIKWLMSTSTFLSMCCSCCSWSWPKTGSQRKVESCLRISGTREIDCVGEMLGTQMGLWEWTTYIGVLVYKFSGHCHRSPASFNSGPHQMMWCMIFWSGCTLLYLMHSFYAAKFLSKHSPLFNVPISWTCRCTATA